MVLWIIRRKQVSFYRSTVMVTVRVSGVSVRIRIRFSVGDGVGIRLADVE